MRKLISYEQANMLDHISQNMYHIPDIILMERAGSAVVNTLLPVLNKKEDTILIVCGGGNNGGDGLVTARLLWEQGCKVVVVFTSTPKSELAKVQYKIVKSLSIPIIEKSQIASTLSTLSHNDWVIDAIAGIGLRTIFRDGHLIQQINSSNAQVLAIDIPTGALELHTSFDNKAPILVNADITITMGLEKTAMYIPEQRAYCGSIVIATDIFPSIAIQDMDANAWVLEEGDISHCYPHAHSNSHKYSKGSVVVSTGSRECPGAGILSVGAASKGPAGIVHAMLDESIELLIANHIPSAVVGRNITDIHTIHAIVAGSGWGATYREERAEELLHYCQHSVPMVLDADALFLLAKNKPLQQQIQDNPLSVVVTPHVGELHTLFQGIASHNASTPSSLVYWWHMAQEVANYYNVIVYAKHSVSMIAIPDINIPIIIDGNNASLATAGSGDVLAGLMGSVLAYLHAPINSTYDISNKFDRIFGQMDSRVLKILCATIISALLHANAGKIMKNSVGQGDASDLLHTLSRTLRTIIYDI